MSTKIINQKRSEYLGMKLYKGEIHAHTSLSDGVKLPKDAFEFVQQNTNYDFFGITEHDVTFDVSTGSDYIKSYKDSYSDAFKALHEQSNKWNSSHFVTIPGVEVTWYDKAGHANLYNTEWFPRTYGKGATGEFGMGNVRYDLPTFYARVIEDPDALVQFNHPDGNRIGDFFGFSHFNKEIDKQITLFEYKFPSYFLTYIKALDQGWHLSPTNNGDEHQANWGTSKPGHTGLWTNELTREGIYDAMKKRRTYSSCDNHFELAFSANGNFMGSILSKDTKELHINISLKDPDIDDHIDKVVIYKNHGEIVKEYLDINSNEFVKDDVISSSNGDYFLVRVFQKDNNEIISAPIWVGGETRGTVYSPEITISHEVPNTVQIGQSIEIPYATAVDHSGESLHVKIEVIDSKGILKNVSHSFKVENYGEYFVKYSATDTRGNTRVKLKRIVVEESHLDCRKILTEFLPIVHVGATEGEVGITLVTDNVLKKSYVQYRAAVEKKWDKAKTIHSDTSYFESAYGKNIESSNYRVLASHKANLIGLQKGTTYKYRYGLSPNGPWGPEHSFETAPKLNETIIYLLGDLQASNRNPDSFQLFNSMLNVLKQKNANGKLMIQVGDLVEFGGSIEHWNDVLTSIYKDLHLISANIVGDHEVIADSDASTFSHFFNLPTNKKGHYKGTNYSFDYGDAHFVVLNSINFTNEQLDWLEQDIKSSNKEWKIVMSHVSYYGGFQLDDPAMLIDRDQLTGKLQQLGISLYIGGHAHLYKRTTIRNNEMYKNQDSMNIGTTFITLGSVFYDIEKNSCNQVVNDDTIQTGVVLKVEKASLSFKAYNSLGETVDEFTLEFH